MAALRHIGRRSGWAAAVSFALIAACGSDGDGSADTDPSTAAATDAPPATEAVTTDAPVPTDVPTSVAATTDAPTTSVAATTTTEPRRATPEEIDAALAAAIETNGVRGATAAVIRDGEVVHVAAVGVDAVSGEPITPDLLFQGASISKAMTAIAVASLVDDGALEWDTDVSTLLTSYELQYADGVSGAVTVEQLLSHTGGATQDGFIGYDPAFGVPTQVEVLLGEGNTPPVVIGTEPGTAYAYSGGGYTILQQALQDGFDTEFAPLLREHVLDPAGATRSTFEQPLPPDRSAEAAGGGVNGDPFEPNVFPEQAAAGIWTTAEEMAGILLWFQREVAAAEPGDAILTLLEPVESFGLSAQARGWYLNSAADPQWAFHEGINLGYHSVATIRLDGSHGMVVMTNEFAGRPAVRAFMTDLASLEGWPEIPY